MKAIIPGSVLQHPEFPALSNYVISSTGLQYYGDHQELLAACLADRMAKRNVDECGAYFEVLRRDRDTNGELDRLVELLTIGETYFFRHRELFSALKNTVFPEIIRRNSKLRRMRIWSAGCSVGAEAYSLSILLRRELGHLLQGWEISILGTDINRQFLAQANIGRFEEWDLRGVPEDLQAACFRREADGCQIEERYQEGVSFQYHNLARHPFPSLLHNLFAFDLILCRNVLIYFGPEIVQRVVDQLYKSLVEGGWLAVGHAEYNTGVFRQFETILTADAILYRKPEPPVLPQTKIAGLAPVATDRTTAPAAWKSDESKSAPPWGVPFRAAEVRAPLVKPRPVELTAALPACAPPPATSNPELVKIRQLADHGEIAAALDQCRSLVRENRLNPSHHFYYALLLDHVSGHAQAETSLRQAIYLDRSFVLAHYYLGLVQLKQHRNAEAARSFRNVLTLLPECASGKPLLDFDELTAADLDELAQRHLEMIEGS